MQHSDFYQHLRGLKAEGAGVLASRLFQGTEWYTEGVLNLSTKEPLASKYVPKVIPTDHSEKAKTIESLKKFADTKLEQAAGGKIQIPGGEVAVKEGVSLGRKIVIESNPQTPAWVNSDIKIIFFGESSKLGDAKENQEDLRASELLDKMISAMKLESNTFLKLFNQSKLASSGSEFDELMKGIIDSKPDYIVSLGAIATNTLLGRKEKLTKVHGQFFPLKLHQNEEFHEVKLMPLFHPDFLLINPNMKRAAWTDLQKIMSAL